MSEVDTRETIGLELGDRRAEAQSSSASRLSAVRSASCIAVMVSSSVSRCVWTGRDVDGDDVGGNDVSGDHVDEDDADVDDVDIAL